MHVSIDLFRILDAFHTSGELAGGPVALLGNVHNVTHVMKSAVYISETCISDALVVYRCHVVVKRRIVTILLSLMVVGSAISGYGSIYMLVHSPPIQGSIFNSSIAPWISSFNVITAATNILATSLIAYSIWRVDKIVSRASPTTMLSPVMLLIIESGAVYAFALLLLTVFYTRDSNAQFIILDGISPLIGIVFCGIIIRVRLYPASEPKEPTWLWTSHGVLTNITPVETAVTTVRTYPTVMGTTSATRVEIK
ncbi:hypothetical protein PHLGIDRAFT_118788 [Phlebiopsis gigantea 11061_1 CR5-6]|uniref:Uncharacterized protein n=1 Tax=Phlebiopsis gigantea (strain 11061_1 CR5-6) TaxID=745531 RepID=A0A0C3NNG9_PHLG1|nr:hypothetical protein PHLGIDRAFT_118788 [Phlebiopsis gigantea 11061_1 CR5-6]